MKELLNQQISTKAISYVCTQTQEWQKYEAFIVKMEAKDYDINIVANYRDFESNIGSSQRQGFAQMMKDIQAGVVPAVIVLGNQNCLPDHAKTLYDGIKIIELDTLKSIRFI